MKVAGVDVDVGAAVAPAEDPKLNPADDVAVVVAAAGVEPKVNAPLGVVCLAVSTLAPKEGGLFAFVVPKLNGELDDVAAGAGFAAAAAPKLNKELEDEVLCVLGVNEGILAAVVVDLGSGAPNWKGEPVAAAGTVVGGAILDPKLKLVLGADVWAADP